jgi:hypothetical protein
MLPCYKRVALIALFVLVSSGCSRSGFREAGDSGVGTCTDDPVMDGSRCKLPDGSLGVCITARGGCVESFCGDGFTDFLGGEACDDGDTSDCTGSCNAECSGPANSCGDGTVRCGESCDDGETSDCSGTCNANCSGPVNSCTDGRICVSGTCVCPGGTIETTCDDSIDNDCDSFVDCADTDCDGKTCGANGLRCIGNSCECPGGTVESVCGDGLDNDCDGNVDCDDSDCNAWPHDREIAIDNQAGTIVLTNYEVEVELISANFVFSEALADGADVRFTDDTQTIQLDYWIKQWDPAAEHALIGVEVPLIPAGGTTSIHMRHGNTCVTTESNGNNVYPYFDHWTTNNTGDWIEQLVSENSQVLWENTRSFDMSRELVMEGQLLNWWSGPTDHTELGWTIDKSSSIHGVESVYVQWHQDTSEGATSAIIPIRLSARVGATLTYTPFVFVDRPESTDILRLSLIFTPSFLSYEWRNLTTDTLLASDSIADAGLIPDISSVQYLFNSNLSCCGIGGNFWSWSSPTCLTWGNNSFNGGMEWQTDYWYIRQYSNPEPIVTVTP